jgi:hypothetical protein
MGVETNVTGVLFFDRVWSKWVGWLLLSPGGWSEKIRFLRAGRLTLNGETAVGTLDGERVHRYISADLTGILGGDLSGLAWLSPSVLTLSD